MAVVIATNAVSATRNTFSESTKNCSRNARIGPPRITLAVSAPAATNVAMESATFTSAATRRWPTSAITPLPASGSPRTARISGFMAGTPDARTWRRRASFFPELLEVVDVEGVEPLADLKEEHAEDDHAH